MTKDYFIELFQYNNWANQRVWDCVMQASQTDYLKENTYSVGSIHQQLLHWLYLQQWWITFLATGESKFISKEEQNNLEDRESFRQVWDALNKNNMAYIQTLTDIELQRHIKAPWWGENTTVTVAQALTHIINHSTDHRAQTLAILHNLGYESIAQDYIAYLGNT